MGDKFVLISFYSNLFASWTEQKTHYDKILEVD